MREPLKPPTAAEFVDAARQAFGFLSRFGFAEVDPPSHRRADPFAIWFRADDRAVVVRGEGYGSAASVTLECDDVELPEIDLVPLEHRPRPWRKGSHQAGQVEQLQAAARRLEQHGSDFLAGDLRRFRMLASALPPYKRP